MNLSDKPADSQTSVPDNLIGEFLEMVDRCMESAERCPTSNHVEEGEEKKIIQENSAAPWESISSE